jgi:hypothetical protein
MQDRYFAAKPPEEMAQTVLTKAERWFLALDTNGYLQKLVQAWSAYYGAYYSDVGSGHQIVFGGEQGELTQLPVNHFRNLCRHMLTMVTANRPAMQARAINTDYKSLVQTKLASGLLDYYLREKRLEDYLHSAIESAIVMGSGYIKMEWNSTAGEIYDVDPDEVDEQGNVIRKGFPIYEGDVKFSNLSPFNVVFDGTKESSKDHDWVLCRSYKNKYDLAAKFPEFKDEILKQETKDSQQRYDFNSNFYDGSDDITVYEFYHKKTEAMPEGRYTLFVSRDAILMDTTMPYRDLPVYRVTPGDIMGTPYGYTDTFDILPIQDALNSLYSAVLTNQSAFAVQNIMVPRGSDFNKQTLSGGMNIIEYNPGLGKPEPINFTNTPPEVFSFIGMLEKVAETISGVNSVARGNPESSLKSGNALALVQSMSLQFISGLQQSYVKLIEDVGTGLVNMLKDFAAVPRVAAIVGESNRTYMKEFSGDDLSEVNRVVVDVANPLSKTTAGRVQMAEQMLQMGLIKSPEQYFSVINYGKLESITDSADRQLLLIKAENETILNGGMVNAVATEAHALHIKEHGDVLADPNLKNDAELVTRVLSHIQEHIDMLRMTDPDLLMIRGEQPLAPPGGSAANQMSPDQMVNTQQMGPMDEVMQAPQTFAASPEGANVNLPSLPQPPAPFNQLPTDPSQMTPE